MRGKEQQRQRSFAHPAAQVQNNPTYDRGDNHDGSKTDAVYLEPAVVGADYEYGNVLNTCSSAADGKDDAEYLEPVVVGADYEYGNVLNTGDPQYTYADLNATDGDTVDASSA